MRATAPAMYDVIQQASAEAGIELDVAETPTTQRRQVSSSARTS